MSSPPWMPLDIDAYLSNTLHLSAAEHGAYMLLIMRYWKDGRLPADERLIARYSQLAPEQWAESRDVLAAFFDDGWKHRRIDAELTKAAEIIGKRKAAGQQRHGKSSAHAEQMESESSYTRVPPSPLPEPEEPNRPSLSEPSAGARDLFDEVWQVFPRNPQSAVGPAHNAFTAISSAEHGGILAAAQRYARWFSEDSVRRKRTEFEGRDFVPKLSTWLASGAWREAASLPIKGESTGPVIAMIRLDRDRDAALWAECETQQGKKAATSDANWAFRADVVEAARSSLAKRKAAAA